MSQAANTVTAAQIVDAASFGEWVNGELGRRHLSRARCLDVGAGDGATAAALRHHGHSVLAIDPREPVSDGVVRSTLEAFESAERFDVILARLSLHHLPNVGVAARAIRSHLADHGLAVILDFGWELADEATVAFARERARAMAESELPEWARWISDADLAGWVQRLGQFHTRAAIDAALAPWFRLESSTTVPYTAAMLGRPDLVDEELIAIDSAAIKPLAALSVLTPRSRKP